MLTTLQLTGLLWLFVFGFAFDKLVRWQIEHYAGDFTARFVVVGVLVTLIINHVTAPAGCFTAAAWTLNVLLSFAASGFWMVIGSWQRRIY